MKTFKNLSFATLIILNSNLASGEDLVTKINGTLDFQAASAKSNVKNDNTALSRANKDFAFQTNASVALEMKNIIDPSFHYGAKIALLTTTETSRDYQSSIFIESDIGRFEFGSDKSAMKKMRITPTSIAAASENWSSYIDGDPNSTVNNRIPYSMSFANFLDGKTRTSGKIEYSRKITYYTPNFDGLQFGVSFIPDSSNVGYTGIKDSEVKHSPVFSKNYNFIIKNGVASGISYENKISDSLNAKISVVGETGQIKAQKKNQLVKQPESLKLRNYTLGTRVDYNQFSFAASYGNYLKSFTYSEDQRKNTDLYGVGVSMKIDKFNSSINYFRSNHRDNKLNATTIAVDYKVAQGLLAYAETTFFDFRGYYINQMNKSKPYKGMIALIGTKIELK